MIDIKALRKQKRLTQEDLQELTGLSIPTIKRAEDGEEVSEPTLRLLALALGVESDYFLDKKGGKKSPPFSEERTVKVDLDVPEDFTEEQRIMVAQAMIENGRLVTKLLMRQSANENKEEKTEEKKT